MFVTGTTIRSLIPAKTPNLLPLRQLVQMRVCDWEPPSPPPAHQMQSLDGQNAKRVIYVLKMEADVEQEVWTANESEPYAHTRFSPFRKIPRIHNTSFIPGKRKARGGIGHVAYRSWQPLVPTLKTHRRFML